MPSPDREERPFEQSWQEGQQVLDRTLNRLKRRQRSCHRRSHRRQQQSRRDIQQAIAQLRALQAELYEYALSWQNLATPFWMAVRFGGLGIVIGWGLCLLVVGGGDRREPESRQPRPSALACQHELATGVEKG